MVFYGYELPKKNNAIRLSNLSISINNANKRNLSNLYQKEQTLSLNMDSLTSTGTTQTGSPSIFTPAVLTKGLQKTDINEFNRRAVTPPSSANNTPATGRTPNLIDELKNKLKNPMFGLTRGLTKNEVKFKEKLLNEFKESTADIRDKEEVKLVLDEIVNQALQNLKNPMTPEEEKIAQEIAQELSQQSINEFMKKKQSQPTTSNAPTMASQEDLDLIQTKLALLKLENTDTLEKFKAFFDNNKEIFKPLNPMYNQSMKLPLPRAKTVSFNTANKKSPKLNDSFEYFKENEDAFKQTLLKVNGFPSGGLRGGNLASGRYYNSWAPNFGNLHIQHKSLKKNNLVINRPYSKTQLIGKKNITQLLKKMIFDIANTLEFDKQDYHNLQKDEKIIIEKIIRLQKDMKDVNLNKLLEDDDSKIKKRIEILIGEVNAGNASSLILKELRELLKKLYDNKAISYNKYQQSLKSINAI